MWGFGWGFLLLYLVSYMNMTDGYRPLQKLSELYFAGGNYSVQLFIYKIKGGAGGPYK